MIPKPEIMTFDRGMVVDGEYTFGSEGKLRIKKVETDSLTYKIGIECLGPKNGQIYWNVTLNGKDLYYQDGKRVAYVGSQAFEFNRKDVSTIEIAETDGEKTEKCYFDISKTPIKQVDRIFVSDRIKQLVGQAEIFKISDNENECKNVKKVLYNDGIVIIYAGDSEKEENSGFYIANNTSKGFVKSTATWEMGCKCLASDSEYTVATPFDSEKHKLKMLRGREQDNSHGAISSWDGQSLEVIEL